MGKDREEKRDPDQSQGIPLCASKEKTLIAKTEEVGEIKLNEERFQE